jgi:hypothetical protein
MDGWTDGGMDGQTDGRMVGWMDGCVPRQPLKGGRILVIFSIQEFICQRSVCGEYKFFIDFLENGYNNFC